MELLFIKLIKSLLNLKISTNAAKWLHRMVDHLQTKPNSQCSVVLSIKSSISTSPLYRKKWFLKQKYIDEKLSARQIAVLVGCSQQSANKALKKFGFVREPSKTGRLGFGYRFRKGIRFLNSREQRLIRKMVGLKEAGMSYRAIATKLEKSGVLAPGGWKTLVRCYSETYSYSAKREMRKKKRRID